MANLKYDRPYAWLNHPIWFMKPVQLCLEWIGTKEIVLASSGNSGREGLNKIIELIKEGHSTLVSTDGPRGPLKKVKDGVLQMSLKTGLPIIPILYEFSASYTIPTWDKKIFPFPFSTLTVVYDKPVLVKEENYEEAREELTRLLNQ